MWLSFGDFVVCVRVRVRVSVYFFCIFAWIFRVVCCWRHIPFLGYYTLRVLRASLGVPSVGIKVTSVLEKKKLAKAQSDSYSCIKRIG